MTFDFFGRGRLVYQPRQLFVYRFIRCSLNPSRPLHLSLGAPDALEETVTLSKAVHGIVGLAHGADEAAEGVDVVLAGDSAAVLVDLGDVDLDRAVVLGLDDAVGGAALAGDVTVKRQNLVSMSIVRVAGLDVSIFRYFRGFCLQVDNVSAVVLHFGGMWWVVVGKGEE